MYYRFLSDFDAYKSLIKNVPMSDKKNEVEKTCNSLSGDSIFDKVPSSNKICKQFIHLYNKFSVTRRSKQNNELLNDNDYSFMNYWINDTLSSSNVDSSEYIKKLYSKLKDADKENFFKDEFKEKKFYCINSHDLENIKIVNDLYKYKDEINNIFTECQSTYKFEPFLKNTREFKERYKEVIINCIDGCSGIYNALETLKCKYNQEIIRYANALDLEFNKLDELQDYNFMLKEHKTKQFKRIITIPTLFPIFGILFMLFFSNKLSQFRQFLLEEINMIRNKGIFEYGSNKLLLRSSDHENINFGYEDYNIGYYSVGDA
ncbi:PIR Superfamily Protein [Plasmodium ovale wallikeri]|uniref:PIR Superfamily Protein n=1 Tax=Plasmodium ovale wallikeri TaxID=864142 RepID=A0A1A9AS34_PLAOA|nr:PIR Superfamily Protein [Plasmodium ovale wallikeri]SBT58974.1 PIR Superfamily Protein [Plasmodium ovale wallikeri]